MSDNTPPSTTINSFMEGHKENFNTLLIAGNNKNLALVHCKNKETGADIAVIVAWHQNEEKGMILTPLAKMFDGNPYDEVVPFNEDIEIITNERNSTQTGDPA